MVGDSCSPKQKVHQGRFLIAFPLVQWLSQHLSKTGITCHRSELGILIWKNFVPTLCNCKWWHNVQHCGVMLKGPGDWHSLLYFQYHLLVLLKRGHEERVFLILHPLYVKAKLLLISAGGEMGPKASICRTLRKGLPKTVLHMGKLYSSLQSRWS